MPDLKIYYPIAFFVDAEGELPSEEFLHEFCVDAATIVARHMNCRDYRNAPISLTQDQIDVHLMPYTYERVRFTNASVLVEITGYDYPPRMESIRRRLRDTQEELKALVTRHQPDLAGKVVNVTYIPIADGCWV